MKSNEIKINNLRKWNDSKIKVWDEINYDRNSVSGYIAREIIDSADDIEFTIGVDSARVINRGITGGGDLIYNFAEVGTELNQFANGWDICILNPALSTGNVICKNNSGTVVYVLTPGMALHGIADSNITAKWSGYYIRSQSVHYYSPDVSYFGNSDNILYLNGSTLEFYHVVTTTNPGETPVSHAAKFSKIGGSSGGGGATNFAKVLFVDPNGNDATGTKGDNSKPFLTIEAAVAAASSGDTVEVMPGSYTPVSNLAKNGVTFYFYPGSIVTKTTSGAIFDYSASATYTSDINILGYGSFYKTTTSGEVFLLTGNTNLLTINLSGNIASATNSNTIYIYNTTSTIYILNFNINKVISSGGVALSIFDYYNTGVIQKSILNIGQVISTGGKSIVLRGVSSSKVDLSYTNSSVDDAFYLQGCFNMNINVGECKTSSGYGFNAFSGCYGVKLSIGYTNTLNVATTINFTGESNLGYVSGNLYGGRFNQLNVTGGVVENAIVNEGTFSGGLSNINIVEGYRYLYTINGGTVNMNGNTELATADGNIITLSSGTLNINGNIYLRNVAYKDYCINQTGGTLVVNAKIKISDIVYVGYKIASLIRKTGGILILNGTTLVKANAYQQFINCPTTAQDIKVYSGGVTTNGTTGDLLSAKARKDSLTVTAVAITTIAINNVSYTEPDITTYNTTALMAARIAALINAGPEPVTATYLSGSAFEVEADVAGTNYTQSGLVNLVNTQLRLNSFAITDIVGGTIIEDSDVTY